MYAQIVRHAQGGSIPEVGGFGHQNAKRSGVSRGAGRGPPDQAVSQGARSGSMPLPGSGSKLAALAIGQYSR
jgi:hypothetical protein